MPRANIRTGRQTHIHTHGVPPRQCNVQPNDCIVCALHPFVCNCTTGAGTRTNRIHKYDTPKIWKINFHSDAWPCLAMRQLVCVCVFWSCSVAVAYHTVLSVSECHMCDVRYACAWMAIKCIYTWHSQNVRFTVPGWCRWYFTFCRSRQKTTEYV